MDKQQASREDEMEVLHLSKYFTKMEITGNGRLRTSFVAYYYTLRLRATMVSKQWFVHASVLFLLFQLCTSIHILSPSRSLTDGGDVLVSKGKTFALGFFSPGNSKNRYVGIWFNVPEKIVVWVANRDNPIKDSAGVLTINGDGNLVIFDGDRSSPLWSTNVSLKTKNSTAKLLDTGNLVLSDGPSNRLLWQSFDYPTHTFLQGMKIGLNRKTGLFWNITSWKSRDDPAPGNYSITLNPRGSPQFFWYKGDLTPYCSSGRWDGLGFSGEPAMRPIRLVRHIFVNNDDEVSLRFVTANSSISSRMVLDEFGYMQRLTSLDGNRHWNVYWTGPTDTCAYYGKCGANGICTSGKVIACQCFPGFKPKYPRQWDLRDWTGGCVRKRALECGKGEGFLKLAQVKVPDSSISRVDMNSSLKDCGKECLKNCSCTAYASADIRSGGRGCITWYGGLMDVRQFTEGGQDLYIRVDADVIAQSRRELEGFLDKEHMVVILTVSLDVGILFMGLGGYYLLKKRRTRKKVEKRRNREQTLLNLITRPTSSKDSPDAYDLDDNRTNPELQFFDLNAIVAATDNFSSSKRLGQGGFGFVYKGQLSDGQEIAVKRLSKNSGQGLEEFRNEVTLIVKLQHRNLVRLLGCCIQEEEKMLIYEYMSNKSLDTFIFDQSRRALLDWRKRFEIIVGIARGILYLHQDSRFRVIHRDLKASNILLNEDLNPKISDFGTARIFVDNQIQANTKRVVGTYGYMSPEYAMKGLFSIKSDVFSFGVLLLEIISGKNNNYYQEDPSLNLIEQAWDLWREGKVWEIVDSSMVDLCPTQEVLRCIQVGLLCVQENASDRPTMSSVVFMLVNETSMPPPNRPPFLVKETLKDRHSSSIDEGTITMVDAR